jgi:hypothetical protein
MSTWISTGSFARSAAAPSFWRNKLEVSRRRLSRISLAVV